MADQLLGAVSKEARSLAMTATSSAYERVRKEKMKLRSDRHLPLVCVVKLRSVVVAVVSFLTFFSHSSFFFILSWTLSLDFLAVDWRGCGSVVGLVIWV